MAQLIDRHSGSVWLEKGLVLTPGLTPDELIQFVGARPTGSFGKSCWYSDVRMETDSGNLIMALYFKGDGLKEFHASIHSGYGPSGALIKKKHDEMLIAMLGRPMEEKPFTRSLFSKIVYKSAVQSWHNHAKELTWKSPWGVVKSTVDPRDGSAQIIVKWK